MFRSERLLRACRDLPCQHCGRDDGTVVAAHSNQLRDGKGRSLKAHDYRVASLCFQCHAELDQGSSLSREQRIEMWENAHRATLGLLIERHVLRVA